MLPHFRLKQETCHTFELSGLLCREGYYSADVLGVSDWFPLQQMLVFWGSEYVQVSTNRPVYTSMWSPSLVLMYFSMHARVLDGK